MKELDHQAKQIQRRILEIHMAVAKDPRYEKKPQDKKATRAEKKSRVVEVRQQQLAALGHALDTTSKK